MERDLKKYIASKFEEQRLRSIKKTTNWNFSISEDIKKVLTGNKDFADAAKKNVASAINPRDRRNVAIQGFTDRYHDMLTGRTAAMGSLLLDFETYMKNARRGGTNSQMRDDGDDRDEDIRSFLVQQVSDRVINNNLVHDSDSPDGRQGCDRRAPEHHSG